MPLRDRIVAGVFATTLLAMREFPRPIAAQSTNAAKSLPSKDPIDTTQGPAPCASDPDRRRFDFWAGDWDVVNKDGALVGRSNVHVVSGGCGLLENWTSLRGPTGKSLNAYNPQTHQWQQYWVGQGGLVTEYRESTWDGKSLSFISRPPASTERAPMLRLTFTPLDDGSVRQHGEQSTDGGTTWTTTYDFFYRRKR